MSGEPEPRGDDRHVPDASVSGEEVAPDAAATPAVFDDEDAPEDQDPVAAGFAAELDAIEEGLAAVRRALDALEAVAAGRCEVCGAPLGEDVLSADPAATRCATHA